MQYRKAWQPTLMVLALLPLTAAVEDLLPRVEGGYLRVAAPGLHILEGDALKRLKDGSAVAYNFQLSLLEYPSRRLERRALEQFVVSYDLWEEKFSIAGGQGARRSVSQLTAPAAEKWCLENITLTTDGVDPSKKFWLNLEVRAEARDRDPLFAGDGLSLRTLVEIFSRPAGGRQQSWKVQSGPYQLASLRQEASGQLDGGRRRLR
jgi:hypothetical protein